jgi:hypothetical protein
MYIFYEKTLHKNLSSNDEYKEMCKYWIYCKLLENNLLLLIFRHSVKGMKFYKFLFIINYSSSIDEQSSDFNVDANFISWYTDAKKVTISSIFEVFVI